MTVIVTPKPAKGVPGCVDCGRGTYDPALAPIAIPEEKARLAAQLTEMVKVPCELVMNHVDGDPHMEKCTGVVWRHRYKRVCDAVRGEAKRT